MFEGIVPGLSVPRIIHQCDFRGWEALPPEVQAEIAALRARNPGWDYRFYDAAAAEAFIAETCGPEVLALYLSIDPAYYSARADLFRYLLGYHVGGVYLDCKSAARAPLDTVIRPDDAFLLAQWPERRDRQAKGSKHKELRGIPGDAYLQWFLVTAPGHPFLKAVLERVIAGLRSYRVFEAGVGQPAVLRLTGPIAFSLAIHPIRALHPHRYVRSDDELQFVYSVYGDHATHRTALGGHYSQARRPVVRRDPVTTALALAWFGSLRPRLERLRARFRR